MLTALEKDTIFRQNCKKDLMAKKNLAGGKMVGQSKNSKPQYFYRSAGYGYWAVPTVLCLTWSEDRFSHDTAHFSFYSRHSLQTLVAGEYSNIMR